MSTTPGTIKHRHQTAVPDGTSDVDASEWNDSEVVAGGTNGDVIMRDATQTDGWGWAARGDVTGPSSATNNAIATYDGTSGKLLKDSMTLIASLLPPAWTTVAYSAANFVGTGTMTWTVDSGDQVRFAYLLIGKTMTVTFYLDTTTTSGTATTEVRLTIPGGNTVKAPCIGMMWIYTGTTGIPGMVRGLTGNPYLSLFRADFANHVIVTNAMVFGGTFTFEIT